MLCITLLAAAQLASASAPPVPADTSCRVPFERFYREVAAHHPVARQARLLAEQARSELQVARGAWDPTVSAELSAKTFGGKEYYDYATATLKIPTPLGADVKVGWERGIGEYSARDRLTPDRGLVTAGLSIPLGQRLVTDERRAALAQAQALRDVADADRRATVNRLLLEAAKDYAAWYEAWRRRAVAEDGVALAAFRLQAVRGRVAAGEAAPVDTLEAQLELRRREVARVEAEATWYAATLEVTAYLWDERGAPVELPAGATPTDAGLAPEPLDSAAFPRWLDRALRDHPDLRRIAGRIRAQQAQRLLAGQQLLPFAEAELYGLAERDPGALPGEGFGSAQDRKHALAVRMPLLLLKERGRFSLAGQRLEQQRLEEDRLRRAVENAARIAAFELATVDRLIALQRENATQARALRDAEARRFDAGESSLLVVNLRERLVLEEELKLAQLEAKYAGARAALAVALGEPGTLPR